MRDQPLLDVLIEAGHTRIGVVAGPPDAMQSRLRLAGIEAAAAAEHIAVSVQAAANRDIGSGFEAARTLLTAPAAPTALICTHERIAVGARLAAADLGLTIPADLSVVSLDDGELLASSLVPQLTTIERPDRAMAEQAVTMTLQRFDEDSEGQIPQYSFQLLDLQSGTRWHVRGARNGHPAAQPIGGDRSAVHDPSGFGSRVGARGVACSTMKGLHHAAVDEDPGWIGRRSVHGRHQRVGTVVNEPQSDGSVGDQFEGAGLERHARPAGETPEAQPFQLGCRPHAEDAIA